MVPKASCDVLIVGAGVVGLSTGLALLESQPNLKVMVLDKELSLGKHASGRNSGVLHAGFYYSPDSLKAKFCRDGNFELKKLCKEFEIPLRECGKVVVTQNEEEEQRLDLLFSRGQNNGVELEIHDAGELTRYEPLARTHRRFMWSPNTAISDSKMVISALAKKFKSYGGQIEIGEKVNLKVEGGEVTSLVKFKHVVNCAGAQADRVARSIGEANDYAMLPFMGVYRAVSEKALPLRTLVYPVPHPLNPFLGVHFTLTIDGKVKIGPTAIPITGREQYSILQGWSLADINQAIKGALALVRRESHDFSAIVKSEWPKLFERKLVEESAKLVPSSVAVKGWEKKPPGIRAQLVHLPTGRLEQDFVVRSLLNSTHVLNAVSPGWTSAIPFGRHIAFGYVLPNLK